MNTTERKTIGKMIYLYCNAKHGTSRSLCVSCAKIHEYAQRRLSKCVYGKDKPTCQNCPIHCYSPEMRDKIREIMKFSGPRMLLHSPVLAVKHLLRGFKTPKGDYPRKNGLSGLKGNSPE